MHSPLNNPNYAHSLQSWGKVLLHCWICFRFQKSKGEKLRKVCSGHSCWPLDGEALVMDWRRVLTSHHQLARVAPHYSHYCNIAHSPPLVSAPTSAPVIAPPVCSPPHLHPCTITLMHTSNWHLKNSVTKIQYCRAQYLTICSLPNLKAEQSEITLKKLAEQMQMQNEQWHNCNTTAIKIMYSRAQYGQESKRSHYCKCSAQQSSASAQQGRLEKTSVEQSKRCRAAQAHSRAEQSHSRAELEKISVEQSNGHHLPSFSTCCWSAPGS